MSSVSEAETRQKLLRAVKKEVKQIMEEAVTRKFVHEESSSITSLCGAVEACLLHGLKKRALGLFKNSTTNALLQKLAKHHEPATLIAKLIADIETNSGKKSIDSNKNQTKKYTYNPKYLWIRLAVFEKHLARILDYLVLNEKKYYESEALIADPVEGPILASLLVGPCALDYTKMKTSDHFWTDPPADELVQRHRIHSSTGNHHIASPSSPRRPGLQVRHNTSSSSEDSAKGLHISAKDYVESLHQNSKSTLLYGKNNVMVQPKEDIQLLAGYLSLHQTAESLTIKWTPNQLMNSCPEEEEEDTDRSLYWDYALTIVMDEIVYLHCHQPPDCGGTIALVGQDGVQRPPILFPKGGHLLAFLSCLETGLLPRGQLDPPLWSQRGKGKVFPKMKRTRPPSNDSVSSSSTDEDEGMDYVFRIISAFKSDTIPPEMLDPKAKIKPGRFLNWPVRTHRDHIPLTHQSVVQTYCTLQEEQNNTCLSKTVANHRTTIKQLCETMKTQIISRAFYGWLAHCRHLKTVRTHLSGLVHQCSPESDSGLTNSSRGLTVDVWRDLNSTGMVTDSHTVYSLVYFGGMSPEIRTEVWPYLLGHYQFGCTEEDRQAVDAAFRTAYEQTMSEWLAVEAIVRQRDKEIMAANLAKLSNESADGHIPLVRKDSNLSNDVFESTEFDVESEDYSRPETLIEESSTTATTPTLETRKSFDFPSGPTYEEVEYKDKSLVNVSPDDGLGGSIARPGSLAERCNLDSAGDSVDSHTEPEIERNIIVTKSSVDSAVLDVDYNPQDEYDHTLDDSEIPMDDPGVDLDTLGMDQKTRTVLEFDTCELSGTRLSASHESLISPASPASNGGVYAPDLLDNMALNLHRIDKDVQRCDRNYVYFTLPNLDKLRNIMCTYVWEHLDIGYVQGMCDLVAPLLVVFDDEAKTYSCFCELMKRMSANFPHGGAMDTHFANMRSLIQILDSELFEHMHQNGDYTHFYFCYRWFLLDFKRELVYDDVFSVWETIWAAKHISSANFVLFIALALVEYYRDIILDNNMDFTDIIKFFNEMAEHHNAKQVLKISRDLVQRLQTLIENK